MLLATRQQIGRIAHCRPRDNTESHTPRVPRTPAAPEVIPRPLPSFCLWWTRLPLAGALGRLTDGRRRVLSVPRLPHTTQHRTTPTPPGRDPRFRRVFPTPSSLGDPLFESTSGSSVREGDPVGGTISIAECRESHAWAIVPSPSSSPRAPMALWARWQVLPRRGGAVIAIPCNG